MFLSPALSLDEMASQDILLLFCPLVVKTTFSGLNLFSEAFSLGLVSALDWMDPGFLIKTDRSRLNDR